MHGLSLHTECIAVLCRHLKTTQSFNGLQLQFVPLETKTELSPQTSGPKGLAYASALQPLLQFWTESRPPYHFQCSTIK